MPDKTVHLPLFGNQPRGAVLAGGAAVVAVGGYLAWKHFTGGSSATGTYGYGQGAYGYGSSSPYGYGAYAYGAYSPYGYSGYYGYGYGYNYGYGYQGAYGYGVGQGGGGGQYYYGYGGGGGTTTTTAITTNAQWAQAAIAGLKGAGFNEMTALVALGRYLAGKEVSQDQARAVEAAIALEGDPPQSGKNGYPPKVKIGPHTGHGKKPKPKKPTHYVITNGQEDMHQIATKYGVTTDDLVGWNPSLKRYVGTGKKVPKGKRIKV